MKYPLKSHSCGIIPTFVKDVQNCLVVFLDMCLCRSAFTHSNMAKIAQIARKHPIEEVNQLDLLTKPISNTSLHGTVIFAFICEKGKEFQLF